MSWINFVFEINILFIMKQHPAFIAPPDIIKPGPGQDTLIEVKNEIKTLNVHEDPLRIDFLYYASNKYINGGWVHIMPQTYIRPVGSDTRYTLLQAINIPMAPQKHHFKTQSDMLFYSLLFPRLSKDVTHIDIIEHDGVGDNWFNFYNVAMETVLNGIIPVNIKRNL
jgi:hypothetical protein